MDPSGPQRRHAVRGLSRLRSFSNLDISLASALKRIVTGELGREVMNRSTAESDSGRILRGRMILRMIYDWYKENSEYTAIYDIKRPMGGPP